MIELVTADDEVSGYRLRAWSGVAVDEGVGLIAMVEVSDGAGRPVCRFEEFLAEPARRTGGWPGDNECAAAALQAQSLERARGAILTGTLALLNGHRFEAR